MPAVRKLPPTPQQIDLFEQVPARAFTIQEFRTEVSREIEMRRWLYRKSITAGKMSISTANEKLNCMQSLMSFLDACHERGLETEGDLY